MANFRSEIVKFYKSNKLLILFMAASISFSAISTYSMYNNSNKKNALKARQQSLNLQTFHDPDSGTHIILEEKNSDSLNLNYLLFFVLIIFAFFFIIFFFIIMCLMAIAKRQININV